MSTRARPKRRIERIRADINQTMSGSEQSITLHTAEDSKTLVRVFADLLIYNTGDNQLGTAYEIVLSVSPGGTNVVTAPVAQALDQDVTLQEITRKRGVVFRAQDGTPDVVMQENQEWHLDTKAARKMKAGDLLIFRFIGSTDVVMRGTVYMWFKE